MDVIDTGGPISVPVGPEVLGRIFNLLGEPLDTIGEVKTKERYPIHRQAPSFEERESTTEVFETGLKEIGRASCRENRSYYGAYQKYCQ